MSRFFVLLTALIASWPVVAADMIPQAKARLQLLDKITARTNTFEMDVGSTVRTGALFIRVLACLSSPPMEHMERTAFIQAWEEPPPREGAARPPKWIFSGWMYASAPAVSAMDNPVYDVALVMCVP